MFHTKRSRKGDRTARNYKKVICSNRLPVSTMLLACSGVIDTQVIADDFEDYGEDGGKLQGNRRRIELESI